MSDFESTLRTSDPLLSLAATPIDFDAMKSRVTDHTTGRADPSRRRQMRVFSFASAAVLVTTVTLVSVTSDNAVFHAAPQGGRSALQTGGKSVIYGPNTKASPANAGFGTAVTGSTDPPAATPIYAASAGLSAPASSGSVYQLNSIDDGAGEAQHLATIFGVSAIMAAVPSPAFAAVYQAGDMGSSTGSMQYFVAEKDGPDAGFATFQYIADGEENWSFDGSITTTVDAATAVRDLTTVRTLWRALDTGFALSDPTWMVMQLSPESNALSTSETQVNFQLSIDGRETTQNVQFSFDDTGKLVYAEGPDLSVVASVVFPFATMSATIDRLNAQLYGDCSPIFVATTGTSSTTPTTNAPTSSAPAIVETLGSASILYQPEMMSNGVPWLVPFYEITVGSDTQFAPLISALAPSYFAVHKEVGSSCSLTLTQP